MEQFPPEDDLLSTLSSSIKTQSLKSCSWMNHQTWWSLSLPVYEMGIIPPTSHGGSFSLNANKWVNHLPQGSASLTPSISIISVPCASSSKQNQNHYFVIAFTQMHTLQALGDSPPSWRAGPSIQTLYMGFHPPHQLHSDYSQNTCTRNSITQSHGTYR